MKELTIGVMAVFAAIAIVLGSALWFAFAGQYLQLGAIATLIFAPLLALTVGYFIHGWI